MLRQRRRRALRIRAVLLRVVLGSLAIVAAAISVGWACANLAGKQLRVRWLRLVFKRSTRAGAVGGLIAGVGMALVASGYIGDQPGISFLGSVVLFIGVIVQASSGKDSTVS